MLNRRLSVVGILSVLAGCGHGEPLRVGAINYATDQTAAAIQFSDPQLYRREALINERREDRAFYKRLLDESAKPDFEQRLKSDVARQVELVSALSASLGLRFSPADATSFAQGKETRALEHSINVTRLEMKLAQLQRDAELLREKLATQTEPSGPPGAPTALGDVRSPEAPSVVELIKQVSELRKLIATGLSSNPVSLTKDVGSSPHETLSDIEAFRTDVKAALNSVSLDELHDKDGGTLIRINFRAAVLPGSQHDVLGLLRMTPRAPEHSQFDVAPLYYLWLDYVARELNHWVGSSGDGVFVPDQGLLRMGADGRYFAIVLYQIPRPGKESVCPASVVELETDPANCLYVRSPAFPEAKRQIRAQMKASRATLDDIARRLESATEQLPSLRDLPAGGDEAGISLFSSKKTKPGGCHTYSTSPAAYDAYLKATGMTPDGFFDLALGRMHVDIHLNGQLQVLSNLDTADAATRAHIAKHVAGIEGQLAGYSREARGLLDAVLKYFPDCRVFVDYAQYIRSNPEFQPVPEAFRAALRNTEVVSGELAGRISVYSVSPVSRVQRVSSALRSAEALEIAARIAAAVPGSGVGADIGGGFSRSSTMRADALERSPIVMGFTEPAVQASSTEAPRIPVPSFGWLLGPKLVPDPSSGNLVYRHGPEPHSLGVELSIPSWWPYILLDTQTAWAPNWRDHPGATALADGSVQRTIRIDLPHNDADMAALTSHLARRWTGGRLDLPSIDSVSTSAVSLCGTGETILLRGKNLWRASRVYVDGLEIEEDKIKVLADMQGISVLLDASKLPRRSPGAGASRLMVWTQNGSAETPLTITGTRSVEGGATVCRDDPPTSQPKEDGAPVIASLVPTTVSACDPEYQFVLQGKNLGAVRGAWFGTLGGTMIAANGGKSAKVVIRNNDWQKKIGTLETLPLTLHSDAGVAVKEVRVGNQAGCVAKP